MRDVVSNSRCISNAIALTGSFYASAEHLNSLCHATRSALFFFGLSNPAAIFLAVGVTEFFKTSQKALLLEQRSKRSGNVERPDLLDLPNLYLNGASGTLAVVPNSRSTSLGKTMPPPPLMPG
jgi:hypothetical protein